MKNDMPQIRRTWDDVAASVKATAADLILSRRFVNGVYGILPGGKCLAVLFSHILKVDYLDVPKPGCLMVRDIWMAGDEIRQLAQYHPIYYADVVLESTSAPPEFYGIETKHCNIEFPWELTL